MRNQQQYCMSLHDHSSIGITINMTLIVCTCSFQLCAHAGNGLRQRICVWNWWRRADHGERSSSVAGTFQDKHRWAAVSFAVPSARAPHVLRGSCSLLSDEGSVRWLEDQQDLLQGPSQIGWCRGQGPQWVIVPESQGRGLALAVSARP